MCGYYFGDDREAEEARLEAVETYSDPMSVGVLRELGVAAGWTCWEVGAGGGSVAHWLADQVGPGGRVLATDIDIRGLQDRSNVEVLRHNVVEDALPEARFDLIHARYVLEHLPEPDQILRRLTTVLRPGGLLVVEDSDGLDLLVDPPLAELGPICQTWESVASLAAWNPGMGKQLVTALSGCGLTRVEGISYRRRAPGGPLWVSVKLGLIRLQDHIVQAGASRQDVSKVVAALDNPDYMISGPPVTIAWGTVNH